MKPTPRRSQALVALGIWCACLSVFACMASLAHADDPAPAVEPDATSPAPYVPVPHGKKPRPVGPVIPEDMPIAFDTYEAQIGDITDEGVITYAFKFTNVSAKTVEVELRGYCHHCGVPVISPEIVHPGQAGAVLVELDPKGKVGEMQLSASVGVKSLPGKEIPLVARARVVPRVRFAPERLGINDAQVSQPAEVRGKLIFQGVAPEISELRCSNSLFVAALEDPKTINDGGHERTEYTLILQLLPGAPAGRQSGELAVITPSAELPVTLQFWADVQPSFKVDPPDVGRGTIGPGADVRRGFSVLARDAGAVSIENITLAYAQKSGNVNLKDDFAGIGDLQLTTSRQAEGHKVRCDLSFRAPMQPGPYLVEARFQGPRGPGDVLIVPIHFDVEP